MKRKLKNKIRAFTVLELLIVMVLSGIVIGLTFLYFTQFRHYLQSTYREENTYAQLLRFQFALGKDITMATEVFSPSTDELQVKFADDEVLYVFDKEWVVRETTMASDTTKLKIIDVSFHTLEDHNDLVREVELEVETGSGEELSLAFAKDYSSAVLFRNFKTQQ